MVPTIVSLFAPLNWLLVILTCKHSKYKTLTVAYPDGSHRFGSPSIAERHTCVTCGKTKKVS